MTFVQDQRLRAPVLRAAFSVQTHVFADLSTRADTYTPVAGLALPVEADAFYAIDGYIAYNTSTSADIKFTVEVPYGAGGHFGLYCLNQLAGNPGNFEAFRGDLPGPTLDFVQQGASGGTGGLCCLPHGFVATGPVSGAWQFRFAQIATTASATTVKAGSWIRLMRLA
jgi:hypothetical protein